MTFVVDSKIQCVGVVLKHSSGDAVELGRRLLAELERRGLECRIDAESATTLGSGQGIERTELASRVDLVVVLGDDGTLLSVARGALGGTPVLGINMGTLGFLTAHPAESLFPTLDTVLAGNASFERRERLEVEVLNPDRDTITRAVLNDVVVNKSALARIVVLSVFVNEEFVSRYRADGLIVATPTGSTAYNLSAGGPILYPTLDAILVTPICPHTLTNRPIALPLDSMVEIRLESRSEEVYLTRDGQEGFPITPRDLVRIRRSDEPLHLITEPSRSYFQILNRKLKWGDRGG